MKSLDMLAELPDRETAPGAPGKCAEWLGDGLGRI
jgi:hypothetical protein